QTLSVAALPHHATRFSPHSALTVGLFSRHRHRREIPRTLKFRPLCMRSGGRQQRNSLGMEINNANNNSSSTEAKVPSEPIRIDSLQNVEDLKEFPRLITI